MFVYLKQLRYLFPKRSATLLSASVNCQCLMQTAHERRHLIYQDIVGFILFKRGIRGGAGAGGIHKALFLPLNKSLSFFFLLLFLFLLLMHYL